MDTKKSPKEIARDARDYCVKHAQEIFMLTGVALAVVHETGYFIRSIKMCR